LREVRIGAAILAAGSSSRLGEPKQLVSFQGKPLLQHTIDELKKLGLAENVVVLGANEDLIKKEIDFKSVKPIHNESWEEGMASSLRLAVQTAKKKDLDGLLVLLSDQPFVNSELLGELIEFYKPNEEMIMASEYDDILGVPALFDRYYYRELMKMTGDTGARKLINTFQEKVKRVKFKKGAIDIDTPEDLKQLNS